MVAMRYYGRKSKRKTMPLGQIFDTLQIWKNGMVGAYRRTRKTLNIPSL